MIKINNKVIVAILFLFVSFPLLSDEGLAIYKVKGKTPGLTLMIIGGIHGDEESGCIAAKKYTDIKLERGNLIVIPEANAPAVREKKRFVNVDMNRIFDRDNGTAYEYKTVDEIKKLISGSDAVINLHESTKKGSVVMIDDKKLKKTADKVIKTVNSSTNKIKLVLYNYRTASKNAEHKEQRKSLTYYALYKKGIPAFAVDLSKSEASLDDRVAVQSLAIDAFMEEFGIKKL